MENSVNNCNYIYSIDAEKEHVIYTRSNNTKFVSYNNANKVVDELFESLCSRCQSSLETSMKGSNFIFDSVEMMY